MGGVRAVKRLIEPPALERAAAEKWKYESESERVKVNAVKGERMRVKM